jgi:hypothetical protein
VTYKQLTKSDTWDQLTVDEKRFVRSNFEEPRNTSRGVRVNHILLRAAGKAATASMINPNPTKQQMKTQSTTTAYSPSPAPAAQAIQIHPITITTKGGPMKLLISSADSVELSGQTKASGALVAFTLILKKLSGVWDAAELAEAKKFLGAEIEAFSEWAAAHPRVFALADKISEQNAQDQDTTKNKN